MKYLFSIIISVVLIGALQAQSIDRQVISSYGHLSPTSSATVGEVITASHTVAGMYTINQGFQQGPKNQGTSIRETELEVSYRLFPNPTADRLNIDLEVSEDVVFSLQLSNAVGQQVNDPQSVAFNQSWNGQLVVEHLPAGVYFLEIRDTESKHVEQIQFIKK